MALEDAVVFGTLFSHMTEWEQVPASLHAYQELRQPRTAKVLKSDIANAAVWLFSDAAAYVTGQVSGLVGWEGSSG